MTVRFCYAVYLQLLNQHNQEFRPYIPDPLSRGAREGSGNETTGCAGFPTEFARVNKRAYMGLHCLRPKERPYSSYGTYS